MLNFLKTIIIGIGILTGTASPAVLQEIPLFGADATLPIAGTTYTLAGSGVSGSATSITLTSLTIPQTGYEILDADLSSTFYITLEPGNRTRQEVASCTTVTQNADNTATLSGCSRGLLPFSPFTASSTYQFAHGGGTSVVFSNPPQLYNEFLVKGNAGYITGVHTYASSSIPRASSTPAYLAGSELQFTTKAYVDDVATSGAANADTVTKGIVQLASTTNVGSGANLGSTGATMVIPSKFFNTTSTATTTVPVTMSNGKISPTFISTSSDYAWTGTNSFGATTTFTGPVTFSGTLDVATATFTGTVTMNNLPIIPTTTPTLGTSPVSKYYLDQAVDRRFFHTTTRINDGGYTTYATSTDFGASGANDAYDIRLLIIPAGGTVSWNVNVNGTNIASTTIAANHNVDVLLRLIMNNSQSAQTVIGTQLDNNGPVISGYATAYSVNMSTSSVFSFSAKGASTDTSTKIYLFDITRYIPNSTF